MDIDDISGGISSGGANEIEGHGRHGLSRRQALGRMSAYATAGAAAWVVPEILTAKPAGAAMSSPGGGQGDPDADGDTDGNGAGDGDGDGGGKGHTPNGQSQAVIAPGSLLGPASGRSGLVRGAEAVTATMAGTWAIQRWKSRGQQVSAAHNAGTEDPNGRDDRI